MKPRIREQILHAYVDGELGPEERSRLLERMERDDNLSKRACELQRTKEWVKSSFAELAAPTRTLPEKPRRFRHSFGWSIAASLLIAIISFAAGWSGHSMQDRIFRSASTDPDHVILHISESDPQRFASIMKRSEEILQRFGDRDVTVEVLANAGGLDLLRTSTSPHADRIRYLMEHYDNIHFFACSIGLQKLREKGLAPVLIEGVISGEPSPKHLIRRLSANWTYIKI